MINMATLKSLAIATGRPSAEVLATADGRVLVANGAEVDVLQPLFAPSVLSTTPVDSRWSASRCLSPRSQSPSTTT